MFKGFISLFTTGIIFNPFVLLGIILGSLCYFNMELNEIRNLFLRKDFFAVVVALASIFVLIFSKRYVYGGKQFDWWAMFLIVVGNVVKFYISFVLVMSFISMFSIF